MAAHALSIFGDHQDVMAVRQTGFALLASNSVQEAQDIALVAHLAAIEAACRFCTFSTAFAPAMRSRKSNAIDYADMAKLVNREAVAAFRARGTNPERPELRGTAQNPDIYYQGREAANPLPEATGHRGRLYGQGQRADRTHYNLFDYVGAPDAEKVIVSMGSSCETIEEVVNYLNGQGEKGRAGQGAPLPSLSPEHLVAAIAPKRQGGHRARSHQGARRAGRSAVYGCLYGARRAGPFGQDPRRPLRSGLQGVQPRPWSRRSSTTWPQAAPKNHFTVGITDDVTNTSLPWKPGFRRGSGGHGACKFWGLGADGTVGANKSAIKIIGDNTDMYAQAYFAYDSKKSGGITISHLRFGKKPIQSTYLIDAADYIACHNPAYVQIYDVLDGIKEGGTFVLNSPWSAEDMEDQASGRHASHHRQKEPQILHHRRGQDRRPSGTGRPHQHDHADSVLQSGQCHPGGSGHRIPQRPDQKALRQKGRQDRPDELGRRGRHPGEPHRDRCAGLLGQCHRRNHCKGRRARVGLRCHATHFSPERRRPAGFANLPDGIFPVATTQYEKRGVAINVPEWIMDNCIQCNQCAMVCPHAAIRPFLVTDEEMAKAPAAFEAKKAIGKELKDKGLAFGSRCTPRTAWAAATVRTSARPRKRRWR
jgi:pyruvate-ferredoxin/flavodoxin oxidoreductase